MTALTIAGSDSGGGAGIQADLKTFAALGVHGACVVTSLTAQNTLAVKETFDLPPEFIEAQFDAIHEDLEVKAAKTGMLSNREIIDVVARKIGDYPLIVDPVMVAESGGRLLRGDAVDALKTRLFPKAVLVTPNISEAEALSGIRIEGVEDMKEACRIISEHGCDVIVKGGHLNATDILYHKGKFYQFETERFDFATHGSGCTFASAITAWLARGVGLVDAVSNAKSFITKAIAASYKPGKGLMVVNQLEEVIRDAERYRIIFELDGMVKEIEGLKGFYKLIPEVGTNIAYALPDAKRLDEVAAVEGRIVKMGERAVAVGSVSFGASKHVATIVLTAMKFDPSRRSAMNIRYSEEALGACEKTGLKVSTFSREREPKEVSTMEWGTTQAIKKFKGVPDVIYDLGAVGKEPMVRVLGKNPRDVLEKVEGILKEV
jgi:hydroxymethylpyrimidine/phosphomethylpyrimidine kinase